MRIQRSHLNALFNRLHDRGEESFHVSHPSAEIGDLVRVSLAEYDDSTVAFEKNCDEYATARQDVGRNHPKPVYDDLPTADQYLKAVLASGMLPIANYDELRSFVDRYGNPDLMAGHSPVVAGFDTNLLPWRIDRILGLRDPEEGVGYVNGFVLATGVRDELDWENKCHDTDPFVDAFGDAYEEYWNQSLGSARIGRLGLLSYRSIRDIQQADEIESGVGDESIIDAYDDYNRERRNDVLLFSNDRNFVERARSHRLLGQWVEMPDDLPAETTATWKELEYLVYLLAVIFGVVELPTVTVHGIWKGKDQLDWQQERLKLDCRSPKLRPKLEADLSIVESFEEIAESGQ